MDLLFRARLCISLLVVKNALIFDLQTFLTRLKFFSPAVGPPFCNLQRDVKVILAVV